MIGIAGVVMGGVLGTVYLSEKILEKFNEYDVEGYDKEGFDKSGYDRNGYNKLGYNRVGYDSYGYDKNGFDMRGFDKEGYDENGFSENGFDREGRDKYGYDREGFDREGYDRWGYDSQGYKRNGFDNEGFNREGVDWQGYLKNGYNQSGIDRAECDRQYYAGVIKKLRFRLDESYQQLQQGKFRYALHDARIVLEEILRLIVQHTNGAAEGDDSIFENMKICERKQLLGDDTELLTRLHEVRHICNFNGHEFTAEERMNHGKVYFVIMQTKDLLNIAEDILCVNELGLWYGHGTK